MDAPVAPKEFTHIDLVSELDQDFRKKITRKSDVPGLLRLASKFAVLAVSSTWIMNGFPGWQLGLLLQGLILIFLFTLLHETVHYTAFKTRWLNDVVGWISALVILLPPNWFRYFHLAHHRYTNDPENDPELAGELPRTVWQYAWTVTGIPVWIFHIKTLFRNASGTFSYAYLPGKREQLIGREARIMLALYAVVAVSAYTFAIGAVFWLWIAPILVGQPFLRLYLMAEHGRCPPVANMLENTRTTYTTRFVRWLAWNMPFHAEHHAFPTVPFHHLPEFHEVAKKHLRVTENGYTRYHKGTLKALSGGGN